MPTVFREGGLRYYFFSNEGDPLEPVHIHVKGADGEAKLWLDPTVAVAKSVGLKDRELAKIVKTVEAHEDEIRRRWDDHFSD